MKMQAKIAALVMALTVAVSPVSAAAEWQQDPYQNWQWTENGVPVTGWEFINQNWYYFDANGYMLTGWQKIEGKQYYFNANGTLAVGWTQVDGNWYYMNGSGEMMTGWQRVEGYWYYLNSQGVMQKGWLDYGRDHYYLDENGAMEIGWVEVDGDWYFMNHDGLLQTGLIEVNGEVFYLDGNGKMLTGKQTIAGTSYQFDAETGAATGSKKPQPGKAFDAFGNEAEVTVENVSGSSGGTTVIYVPTQSGDSGNSGNQGGWDDGWDDDWDDDDDNPGWNPGGDDGDDDDGDIPSGETPEPVEGDLAELDEFFASMVPQINADYGRDFNVSFDPESHVITVAVKNLEKRITNIWYGNLLHDLVEYKNGIVTDFQIEDYGFRRLYNTRVNSQGSEYHNPIFLSAYASDFLQAGLKIFATTESLIGTSTEVTLLLGDEIETRPYTVQFVQAAETVTDEPNAKVEVVYSNISGNSDYAGYHELVDCIQEGNNILIDYVLPEGMEYQRIDLTMGGYGYLANEMKMLSFANTAPISYKTPVMEIVPNSDDSYTTYCLRDDGRVDSIKISYTDRGIILHDLDISNFCYYQYEKNEKPAYDLIGRITVSNASAKNEISVDVGLEQTDYKFTSNGLTVSLPEGDVYDIWLHFLNPITLYNGYSVQSLLFSDLLDTSNVDSSTTFVDTNFPAYYRYPCVDKVISGGEYRYKFEYFDFRIVYSEVDGQKQISFPQLTKKKLQDVSLEVRISTEDTFTWLINGYRNVGTATWGDDGRGLTIHHNGYGAFVPDELQITFADPVKVTDNIYLSNMDISTYTRVNEDGEREEVWQADVCWRNAEGDYLYSRNLNYDDFGNSRTYHFMSAEDGFDFTLAISEDGKSITFPNLYKEMLDGNIVSIRTYTH